MTKANSIREAILANFDTHGYKKQTWKELAAQNGFNFHYMMDIVKKLKAARVLPMDPVARAKKLAELEAPKKAPKGGDTSPVEKRDSGGSTARLEGITFLAGSMSREERIQTLADIARSGNDLSKISAISKLEEFERAAGSTYGPPPPTTQTDTVQLLLELLLSLPRSWVQEAIKKYYEKAKNEFKAVQEAESNGLADSESDMAGRDT